jgi:hypothetical protein
MSGSPAIRPQRQKKQVFVKRRPIRLPDTAADSSTSVSCTRFGPSNKEGRVPRKQKGMLLASFQDRIDLFLQRVKRIIMGTKLIADQQSSKALWINLIRAESSDRILVRLSASNLCQHLLGFYKRIRVQSSGLDIIATLERCRSCLQKRRSLQQEIWPQAISRVDRARKSIQGRRKGVLNRSHQVNSWCIHATSRESQTQSNQNKAELHASPVRRFDRLRRLV